MDPFVDLIRLLRPKATTWAGIHGSGRWGVSFRKHDDLLFCWVQKGVCQVLRPGLEAATLAQGDFVLIRTVTPFSLASDATAVTVESEDLVAKTGDPTMRVGESAEPAVILRGGRFDFETANEQLLAGLLPPFVHVAAEDAASWRVRSLLRMNETESLAPGVGSDFIIGRLMELILVEILRGGGSRLAHKEEDSGGLLAGLADPVTAPALQAMHRQPAYGWTVAELARLCGVSRSSLAARFGEVVGLGPIEYLQTWRIALAKDELRHGRGTVGEIAFAIGFQSPSAFSTAFRRAVGCSPKQFAERSAGQALE